MSIISCILISFVWLVFVHLPFATSFSYLLATHGDGLPDLAQVLISFASERGYDNGETKEIPKMEEVMTSSPQTDPAPTSSSSVTEASMTENKQPPMSNAIALEDRVIQLAIMGRPNVGKSSLLNAFIGESRVIVGSTPGECPFILLFLLFSLLPVLSQINRSTQLILC